MSKLVQWVLDKLQKEINWKRGDKNCKKKEDKKVWSPGIYLRNKIKIKPLEIFCFFFYYAKRHCKA